MNDEEAGFKTAAGGFREYNFPFWLAVTELEHGEWLAAQGRGAEAEPLLRGGTRDLRAARGDALARASGAGGSRACRRFELSGQQGRTKPSVTGGGSVTRCSSASSAATVSADRDDPLWYVRL